MTDNYVRQSVRLRFSLGEFRLFSLDLPLLVSTVHFLDCDAEREPTVPAEALGDEVEGVLFRSHPIGNRLSRLSFANRMIRYVPSEYRRFYVVLEGTFDEYLAKFSSKSRSTLRRKVRKYADICRGNTDFRVYRSSQEIREFFQLAREVSAKTYQERLLAKGLPDTASFIEEAVERASSDGLRGYLLLYDQRPVSYLYCPIREGVLFYQYLGYDPAYASWSPGTVLQYLVLERLFAESGPRVFDFTEGEGQHKEFFSTGNTRCADIYYLKRTIRNLIVVATHCGLHALTRMIVRMSEILRLKKLVKRVIRRSA